VKRSVERNKQERNRDIKKENENNCLFEREDSAG
jgi:hypothetical protein